MTAEPAPLAIVGAAVFDGGGGPPAPDRTVVVRGGRIERVGPPGAVRPPPGAVVVGAAGCTLLPGVVDAHVHLGFYPPAEVLRGGVTTVRDLGWRARRCRCATAARRPPRSPCWPRRGLPSSRSPSTGGSAPPCQGRCWPPWWPP